VKISALIPVFNNAYVLEYALKAAAPFFDEILVYDDASTDHSVDVVERYTNIYSNIRLYKGNSPQVGPAEAKTRLALKTKSHHLFALDADDVLIETKIDELREYAVSKRKFGQFRLCEMMGDFYHTTQRLRHRDRSHSYIYRTQSTDVRWFKEGHKGLIVEHPWGQNHIIPRGPHFFHLKLVKPDWRLVEGRKRNMWSYLGDPNRRGSLHDVLKGMSWDEIHADALKIFTSGGTNTILPTYLAPINPDAPRRPQVILNDLPGRFRVIYEDGKVVDRIDMEDPHED
jgi:glycosyltransferase involved in cell wall biosynthesis